jgi:hypothetical protein
MTVFVAIFAVVRAGRFNVDHAWRRFVVARRRRVVNRGWTLVVDRSWTLVIYRGGL